MFNSYVNLPEGYQAYLGMNNHIDIWLTWTIINGKYGNKSIPKKYGDVENVVIGYEYESSNIHHQHTPSKNHELQPSTPRRFPYMEVPQVTVNNILICNTDGIHLP